MNIVIFTRTGYHHTSFINRLQEEFEISCVVREAYPGTPEKQVNSHPNRDEAFLTDFQKKYSAGFSYHPKLNNYLKSPSDSVIKKFGVEYLDVRCGEINSKDFEIFLKKRKPDVIAVLGSSLIKNNIISIPSTAFLNLHSGLSPYYRGIWSHVWPIVNREPEFIGVTVHHVNAGIDTGDIIFQTKPGLNRRDDLNDIFLKVIAEGTDLVVKAIREISDRGLCVSHKQPADSGRNYNAKEFNADAARRCLENLESGIIEKYNLDRDERDSRVKLYGYIPPNIFK